MLYRNVAELSKATAVQLKCGCGGIMSTADVGRGAKDCQTCLEKLDNNCNQLLLLLKARLSTTDRDLLITFLREEARQADRSGCRDSVEEFLRSMATDLET